MNVHKSHKVIEQLYCYLEIPKTNRITLGQWLIIQKKPGLNRWLSCTQHVKQNNQRNENFKWAIQFLVIATYT